MKVPTPISVLRFSFITEGDKKFGLFVRRSVYELGMLPIAMITLAQERRIPNTQDDNVCGRRGEAEGGRCLLAYIWLASKARRWMNLAGKPHWRVFPSVVRQTRLQWLAISLHRLRRDVSVSEDNTDDNLGIYRLSYDSK